MNGGTDRVDTSYEELRTAIQQRLSTAKSREDYISKCVEILQEIAIRPDAEKFLDVYGDKKTFFYDLTPDLIKQARAKGKEGLEDCLNDDKTKTSDVQKATDVTKKKAIGNTEIEQANEVILKEEE